jgi:hypothetical protein
MRDSMRSRTPLLGSTPGLLAKLHPPPQRPDDARQSERRSEREGGREGGTRERGRERERERYQSVTPLAPGIVVFDSHHCIPVMDNARR